MSLLFPKKFKKSYPRLFLKSKKRLLRKAKLKEIKMKKKNIQKNKFTKITSVMDVELIQSKAQDINVLFAQTMTFVTTVKRLSITSTLFSRLKMFIKSL